MTNPNPLVGATFHFLATGVTYLASTANIGGGANSTRGDQLVITEDLLECNTNRNGWCWLELLTDPEAQIARYGRQLVAEGPRPADMLSTEPGTSEHMLARSRARAAAYAQPDPIERTAALAKVRDVYGDLATSKTLATYE